MAGHIERAFGSAGRVRGVAWLGRATGGLTLIELLIVLSILGVLAAIVLGNVTGMSSQGKDSSFQEDRNSIQKASDTYYSLYKNSYPTRNLSGAPTATNSAYIDFFRLLSIGKLLTAPQSAGGWNNTSLLAGFSSIIPCSILGNGEVLTLLFCAPGLGSYSWWVDDGGVVHSQNTAGQTDTYNGRYP